MKIRYPLLVTLLLAFTWAYAGAEEVESDQVGVTGPITVDSKSGPFAAPAVDVAARGYVVEEYFIDGLASTYKTVNDSQQTTDGQWLTEREAPSAPYKTRILVVRPVADRDFNGTVIVHWQNVTAGYELGTVTDGEYLRGYAWVGVSAQIVGVNGFPGPDAAGLKQWDNERYSSLVHPGDAFSFDMFSQAGKVVSANRQQRANDPMGGLNVRHLVAAGASQSASRLRTYINAVHPHAQVFDGYIPYIDFGSAINLAADKSGERRRDRLSTSIRTDLDVPVFVVNSETETQAYAAAHQQNTERYRFWEVAGTSHVSVPRGTPAVPGLDAPNWLSYTPVYDAAIRHMHAWLTAGTPPPIMPLIETAQDPDGQAVVQRDQHGNAIGGIRLPDIVAPIAGHSGLGTRVEGGNRFAFLYGRAADFSDAELAALYPQRQSYLDKYTAALKQAVDAGVVLPEDALILQAGATAWSKRLANPPL